MYKTFNPSSYEDFSEIETINDDFILLAYGDAANKMRPSMIGTSINKKELKILTYSIQEDIFKETAYMQENEIVHVIACDFLNEGVSLSYILVYKKGEGDEKRYGVSCFTPTPNGNVKNIVLGECTKMPFLFSRDDWSSCVLLQNGDVTTVYTYKNGLVAENVENFPNLAIDHSSAFIDVDGDMKPEFVFVTESEGKRYITILEDYTKGNEVRQSIEIPDETGPIGFGDFNASGAFDIVYISKEGNDYYYNILLNKRPAFVSKETEGKENLKYTNHTKFTEKPYSTKSSVYYHRAPLDFSADLKPQLKASNEILNGLPSGLLVADIAVNSYPDIILLMEDAEGNTCIRILENKSYTDLSINFAPMKVHPKNLNDILSVSIADIRKTGSECLIINRVKNGGYSIGSVASNISKDSYKIHATTLRPGTKRGEYQASVPGVSYKYYMEESEFTRIGYQMAQSSHLSLQTQTTFFGLGYTNYLVDKFFVSGPSRTQFDKIYLLHSKILPNSEMVLIPNQKTVVMELYLSFSKNITNIVVVFTAVLFFNLLLVYYTYRVEKEKERKMKKREAFLFNFQAL